MFQLFAGLVLGAILGVAIDRIWQRVERRPRFYIRISYEQTYPAPGVVDEGLLYSIENVGPTDVPDYAIGLFHPRRGTIFAFSSEQSGPLIPREIREHHCILLRSGQPADSRAWFFHESDKPVAEVEFVEFQFRLVMKSSERILFESETIGNSLAEQFVRTFKTGRGGQMSGDEQQALCTPPRKSLRSRWNDIRALGHARCSEALAAARRGWARLAAIFPFRKAPPSSGD